VRDNPALLLAAYERRFGAGKPYLADLFPKQRAFFEDPAKVKAALCGRRAGKTWVDAVGLYDAARSTPKCQAPYITLSGVQARRIFWPVLEAVNDRYSLGMKMHRNELIAELENGSQIFCVGGDDARKVEALRGSPYKRVVVDEVGSFPRELARYLVEEVLDAALLDLNGDLWLTGSPNAACTGYFYDATTGTNAEIARLPTHHWTVLDNTYLPHAGEWLERKRASKGWDVDHPVYRREYLGQWVRDLDSLVFRFDRARHLVPVAPEFSAAVVGVDLGASRQVATTAFCVTGWTKHDRATYTVWAKKHAGMTPTTSGDEAERLLRAFHGRYVVVDEGALGAGYAEEWRQRSALSVLPAQKRDKFAFVEFLNGELDAGRAFVLDSPDTRALVDELELLQWNEDRDGYDERFADHSADAWLYSWRECYSWAEPPKSTAPAFGSAEAIDAEEEAYKTKRIAEAEKAARKQGRQMMRRWR